MKSLCFSSFLIFLPPIRLQSLLFEPKIMSFRSGWKQTGHFCMSNNDNNDFDMLVHTMARITAAVTCTEVFLPSPPMLEPPAKSEQEHQQRQTVNKLLNNLQLWEFPVREEGNHMTYGEVTTVGARQLFHYMRLKNSGEPVHFVDLGMGCGKLVVQALLDHNGSKESDFSGIELSKLRYNQAVSGWTAVAQQLNLALDRITLRKGDLFDMDLSTATHIYLASLCFDEDMMTRIADKIASSAKSIVCVASLRELPGWTYSQMEYVEMTWTRPRGCLVYFYFVSPG